MSTTIPDVPPVEFSAGETLCFDFSSSDYPAGSSWELNWYLKGDSQFTWAWSSEVAASGDDFRTTVAASSTASIGEGRYWLIGQVTKSGEVHQVYNQECTVLPDASVTNGSFDGRSHARKVLDAIEDVIEGRATRQEASYSIGGGPVAQQIELASFDDLLKFRNRYKSEVKAEEEKAARERGEKTGRKILTRFV